MSAPVKKNDDISPEITGMTSEGHGVGRVDGFAVFVPFALPHERVTAHIIKVAGSYAVGKLVSVEEASPERAEPLCPVFLKCGGCALRHMRYEAQLEFKRGVVRDALERIGGFKGIEVKPTIGMDEPRRYRNKGSFPFGTVEGRAAFGLFAPRSHRLIEIEDCEIESESAVLAARAVRDWANAYGVPVYDETAGKGVLRHAVTRVCTGGVAVTVVTTGRLPHGEELIEMLKAAVPNLVSVVHNVNPRSTNVICGEENRVIFGEKTVLQRICGLDFEVSPESFLQVNPIQTEKLYSLAADALGLDGTETCADVFCGIGTIALMLAKRAKSVVGIEYVERAIEDAKANARRNGISNAEFFAGAAEDVLPRLVAEGLRFDCISLDPPRKGAEPEVLSAIAASGASKVVYVSCGPASLARDLKLLAGYGYEIQSVQPVDMFPMTAQVETVVRLSRSDMNS